MLLVLQRKLTFNFVNSFEFSCPSGLMRNEECINIHFRTFNKLVELDRSENIGGNFTSLWHNGIIRR